MGIVENALKREKLKLHADALPKEQRTVKCFQRLIAAMRAAEAEVQDRLGDSERQLNEALRENLTLHERIRVQDAELLRLRLKDHMEQIPALTVSDKTKLLEASGIGTA